MLYASWARRTARARRRHARTRGTAGRSAGGGAVIGRTARSGHARRTARQTLRWRCRHRAAAAAASLNAACCEALPSPPLESAPGRCGRAGDMPLRGAAAQHQRWGAALSAAALLGCRLSALAAQAISPRRPPAASAARRLRCRAPCLAASRAGSAPSPASPLGAGSLLLAAFPAAFAPPPPSPQARCLITCLSLCSSSAPTHLHICSAARHCSCTPLLAPPRTCAERAGHGGPAAIVTPLLRRSSTLAAHGRSDCIAVVGRCCCRCHGGRCGERRRSCGAARHCRHHVRVCRALLVGASLTSAPASGAQILEPDAEPAPGAASAAPPSTQAQRDGRDIYLPNHVESVSHIALDVSRRSWLVHVDVAARAVAALVAALRPGRRRVQLRLRLRVQVGCAGCTAERCWADHAAGACCSCSIQQHADTSCADRRLARQGRLLHACVLA
jgi:hypothetical protein